MARSFLERICDIVARSELALILLLAPVLLFPTPQRLLACLIVPGILACARRATGQTLPPTVFDWPIAMLVGMAVVSLAVTFDPLFSLGKVCGVVLGALVFYACVRVIRRPDDFWIAALVFVAAGAGLAAIGLLGTAWLGKFPLLQAITNRLPAVIRGVAGAEEGFHPNPVAGALLLFLPVQVGALVAARSRGPDGPGWSRATQALVLGATALTGLTILLTQSRGAWVGLAAGVWAAAVIAARRRRAVLIASIACVILAAGIAGPRRALDAVVSQATPEIRGRVNGRLDIWRLGFEAASDAPLTGTGMNTFRRLMPIAYPSVYVEPGFDVAHAHNQLLQTALDLGVPGLVGYVSILLLAWALLASTFRHGGPARRPLALGLATALLAHSIFGIADAIPLGSKVGIVFWLYLALVTGLHHVSIQSSPDPEAPATGERRLQTL